MVEALKRALPERCVVDGEIIIAGERGLDFDALQMRLHPAESRIRKLSKSTPARFVAFDLLALGDWVAVEPKLVCEVRYDYLQGPRFRHGTTFLRWRPDRDPRSCTFEQLAPVKPFKLEEVIALARARRR